MLNKIEHLYSNPYTENYTLINGFIELFSMNSPCFDIQLNTPLAQNIRTIDLLSRNLRDVKDQLDCKLYSTSRLFYNTNNLSEKRYIFGMNDLQDKNLNGFASTKLTDANCFYMVNFNVLRNNKNRDKVLIYKYNNKFHLGFLVTQAIHFLYRE